MTMNEKRNRLMIFAAATCATTLGTLTLSAATAHAQATAVPVVPAIQLRPSTSAGGTIDPAGAKDSAVQPGQGAESPLAAPSATAAASANASPRLQAFLQLTLDRRPTSVLSAWSQMKLGPESSSSSSAAATATATATTPVEVPAEVAAELAEFQRHVSLGEWEAVRDGLGKFEEAERPPAYAHLLRTLASGPPLTPEQEQKINQMPQMREMFEKNVFGGEDIFGLATANPGAWDKTSLSSLGSILRQSLTTGLVIDDFLAALRKATSADAAAPGRLFSPKESAQLLAAAGQISKLGEFLPTPQEAEAQADIELLNLISQYYLARYGREGDNANLQRAWEAIQAALAVKDVPSDARAAAIRQSVELAPKVSEEIGQTWLAESFTSSPERGMQILAVIGAAAASGLELQPTNSSFREQSLRLQQTAVEALLKAAPERAADWQETLDVLARVWMNEAEYASNNNRSLGRNPYMQRDVYGNIYYVNPNEQMTSMGNQARPLAIADVIKCAPDEQWIGLLDESLQPKLLATLATLHLRVNEDKEAFPYIERLAPSHRELATSLATEFIQVWTRNHNPNQSDVYRDPYVYMYGFDVKAQSIPLTRAKQERNLQELAEWITRIRALNLEKIKEDLLTTAFTTCHSTAEVYRLETIESVFGSIDALEPDTLASLSQRMRQNLASVWRDPAVQQTAKTNRKKQDLEAEVKQGYLVARSVLDAGLSKHPDHWGLLLARASLLHDENDYVQELSRNSEYSLQRQAAFDEFARAAEAYAAVVPTLKKDDEETRVYETWFYAALGACDPGNITHEKVPAMSQIGRIKAAIEALGGEPATRHMDAFANLVFTRMSTLNPAVKSRYLDAAFEIVGDNERAFEARKVHEYYADLVQEIKLEAVLDGSASVGHGEPFGVFVNLVHTPEIERESGGFTKYLQNQNNMMYAYNYGRPLENYRDKFRTAAIEALGDHFEVVSVTFQAEDVTSRSIADKYGWRMTPYAYILLKSRTEAVDMLPPLRLDLDFLDTSGYVVLPIESPPVPLDSTGPADERPLQSLEITQTLDERQAKDGKLILEVKATGRGLVPELKEILDPKFPGFEVGKLDDDGGSISRFDAEAKENLIVSERTWLVTMQAEQTGETAPAEFAFATPLVDAKTTYQRYVDADLQDVPARISLEAQYGEKSYAWAWWLAAGVGGVALAGFFSLRALRRPRERAACRFQVPERITPFSVLSLLRDIEENNGLRESERTELQGCIVQIERSYFDRTADDSPDLRELATRWVRRSM